MIYVCCTWNYGSGVHTKEMMEWVCTKKEDWEREKRSGSEKKRNGSEKKGMEMNGNEWKREKTMI